MVTCYKNKRLSLKKGMTSMANILGVAHHNVARVPTDEKLPDDWVCVHMNPDVPEDLSPFVFTYGDVFTPERLKKIGLALMGNVGGRLKNGMMHEIGLKDLPEAAIIPYAEVEEAEETTDEAPYRPKSLPQHLNALQAGVEHTGHRGMGAKNRNVRHRLRRQYRRPRKRRHALDPLSPTQRRLSSSPMVRYIRSHARRTGTTALENLHGHGRGDARTRYPSRTTEVG
jgi:hypothetical protein